MNDSHTAIQAWLDRCDQTAAQWLVQTHRPMVRRTVCRWLPHDQMVEDVVQETFIKAFKAMHHLLPGSNFEGWLCCIARNTCANHLRGWQRNIVKPAAEYGIEDCNDLIATDDAAFGDNDEIEKAVEKLLSSLQHQERTILIMSHLEGRSARDVGQCLGMTAGNVRIRVMRTLRALRSEATAMRAEGMI